MTEKEIVVYTDGACMYNGKICAVGGIGIHFPNKELQDISKSFDRGVCTNQKAELYAILLSIKYIRKSYDLKKLHVVIKTDSSYCISCITNWIKNWLRNGWLTKKNEPVINKEYIEQIYYYYEKYNITFEHVAAHTLNMDPDSVGNRQADKLAADARDRAALKAGLELETKVIKKRHNFKDAPEEHYNIQSDYIPYSESIKSKSSPPTSLLSKKPSVSLPTKKSTSLQKTKECTHKSQKPVPDILIDGDDENICIELSSNTSSDKSTRSSKSTHSSKSTPIHSSTPTRSSTPTHSSTPTRSSTPTHSSTPPHSSYSSTTNNDTNSESDIVIYIPSVRKRRR